MSLNYKFEAGDIEKVSTNRLLDIDHNESLSDFYMLHPEYSEIWDLGEAMEHSKNFFHQRAGKAIKRLMAMLITDKKTENINTLLSYAKNLNKRLISSAKNEIRHELALEYAYMQIRKGFDLWKVSIKEKK